MNKPGKWRKAFEENDLLASGAGITATVLAQSALNHLVQHFLGPITPRDAVWWVLSILAIAVGLIVYAVVLRLRRKGQ